MKKVILATALATSMGATAQTEVSNSPYADVCAGTISYAKKHMSNESLPDVINAQREIIIGEKQGDTAKFVGLTTFIVYQLAAYNWQDILDQYGDIDGFDNEMFDRCINALNTYQLVEKDNRGSTEIEIESIW